MTPKTSRQTDRKQEPLPVARTSGKDKTELEEDKLDKVTGGEDIHFIKRTDTSSS
jgi:hypothetical protein